MRKNWAAFVVLTLGGFTILGCGDGMTELKGAVTYEGEPIPLGSIAFAPIDGKGPTAGGEIKEGKYLVRVPVAELKVEIRYPKVVGKKKDYDAPGGKFYDLFAESLPPKYNDASTLKVQTKPGSNTKDWDLTKK